MKAHNTVYAILCLMMTTLARSDPPSPTAIVSDVDLTLLSKEGTRETSKCAVWWELLPSSSETGENRPRDLKVSIKTSGQQSTELWSVRLERKKISRFTDCHVFTHDSQSGLALVADRLGGPTFYVFFPPLRIGSHDLKFADANSTVMDSVSVDDLFETERFCEVVEDVLSLPTRSYPASLKKVWFDQAWHLEVRDPGDRVYIARKGADGKWVAIKSAQPPSAADIAKKEQKKQQKKINDKLTRTAGHGDLKGVMAAVAAGAEIDYQETAGLVLEETALLQATEMAHEQVVEWLLSKKADVNKPNKQGVTPLIATAQSSEGFKIAKILLAHGADPNRQDAEGRTALMHSSENYYADTASVLLTHKADPNLKDKEGKTALHYAMRGDRRLQKTVELLLAHGADPNLTDNQGCTPFMLAADVGFVEIVKLLLVHKADPNLKDKEGRTALDYAVAAFSKDAATLLRPLTKSK